MNDKQSNLEAELASLQPHRLSTECLGQIDQALSNAARPSSRLYGHRLLLATALAAACFLVGATVYWGIVSEHSRPLVVGPMPAPAPGPSQPLATIAVYRQAIARGPGAVDALLDREAAVSLRTKPGDNLLRAGLVPDSEWMN